MNPWRRTAYEREPGSTIAEGLADRADLKEELRYQIQHHDKPDFLILEELKSLRFAVAIYGVTLLTISITSLTVLLYAVLE